ncbi:hypothetical protein Tgr7_1770 [Thioalkalivibrio sulfidiphilus HL-EbGr7]|uniref:Uncharacterized protein n=1 Tax=Thioalkalivibrio sulfidiphilus (strain HL-EbGR7) TaxID=396588 RepID=B8GSE8_THISH|nr:hypothetical protein [Thioalkalivibrio sulfidiphilus]ACL72852.1 hypothetical protein Tgr7_1770 [Thioalkalivibrio sulfidiphilus HL-EbGr7]
MNKQQFNEDRDVKGFISWAVYNLNSIEINLRVSRSGTGMADGRKGPGVSGRFVGVNAVVHAYQWRSELVDRDGKKLVTQDWTSTRKALEGLGVWLREEVDNGNQDGALEACRQIVKWGGDRNSNVGAIPFLENKEDLPIYLKKTRDLFHLECADTNILEYVGKMNAMLTKVHALNSRDGLPIYDSRVAAAISSLIEVYRVHQEMSWKEMPKSLDFKATERRSKRENGKYIRKYDREVQGMRDVYQPVVGGGLMPVDEIAKAKTWSSCKIRLGWLLEAIICEADQQNRSLFDEEVTDGSMRSKMHAFEAALFMMGFDVGCF